MPEDVNIAQCLELKDILNEGKKVGENAIGELMSDEVSPFISNAQQLMEKMLGYQDIVDNALALIESSIAEQQQMSGDNQGDNKFKKANSHLEKNPQQQAKSPR